MKCLICNVEMELVEFYKYYRCKRLVSTVYSSEYIFYPNQDLSFLSIKEYTFEISKNITIICKWNISKDAMCHRIDLPFKMKSVNVNNPEETFIKYKNMEIFK